MLTKEAQRYDFFHDNGFSPVFECKEGDYVLFTDYLTIESALICMEWENEKLLEEIGYEQSFIDSEVDALKAKIKELKCKQ